MRRHEDFSNSFLVGTVWKVSKYGVFSGPYFPALGLNTEIYWTEYVNLRSKSPYLVRIQENTDQKKLRVWTLSTQCCRIVNAITTSGFSRKIIDLLYAALMPAGIYLLKVNNRNIRARCEICSELTIKIPGRRQRRRFGIFIVNFELILHLVLVFLLLTLNM